MNAVKLLAVVSLFFSAVHCACAADTDGAKEFVYKKTPEAELKLHVHFPADWKSGDKRPAIVFFFGGGWTSGTVNQSCHRPSISPSAASSPPALTTASVPGTRRHQTSALKTP